MNRINFNKTKQYRNKLKYLFDNDKIFYDPDDPYAEGSAYENISEYLNTGNTQVLKYLTVFDLKIVRFYPQFKYLLK